MSLPLLRFNFSSWYVRFGRTFTITWQTSCTHELFPVMTFEHHTIFIIGFMTSGKFNKYIYYSITLHTICLHYTYWLTNLTSITVTCIMIMSIITTVILMSIFLTLLQLHRYIYSISTPWSSSVTKYSRFNPRVWSFVSTAMTHFLQCSIGLTSINASIFRVDFSILGFTRVWNHILSDDIAPFLCIHRSSWCRECVDN